MVNKGSIKLETDRIILRKLSVKDAKEVFKNWTSDENVSRYMRWTTHKNVEDTIAWLKEEEENYKRDNYYNWGIELKQTKELIGSISALYREEDDRYDSKVYYLDIE